MSDFIDQTLANPTVTAVFSAIAVALVALWLAAAWWAYSDAARRTESTFAAFLAASWVVLSTPLLLPLSLMVYGFARPQVTAADHRARALVVALGATTTGPACAACRAPVESAWLRCPACSNWLAAPCAGCGEWSDPRLEICPWCGREGHDTPAVEITAPVAASTPFLRTRRARAAWRPVGPGASRVHRQGLRAALTDGRPLAPVRGRG
jgi:hypothetical protein